MWRGITTLEKTFLCRSSDPESIMASRFRSFSNTLLRNSGHRLRLRAHTTRHAKTAQPFLRQQHAVSQAPDDLNSGAPIDNTSKRPKPNQPHRLNINLGHEEKVFSAIFLRDSCQCARCVDPSTQQKLFQTADIPSDIQAVQNSGSEEGLLRFSWVNDIPNSGEDHITELPAELLVDVLAKEQILGSSRAPLRERTLWDRQRMQADNLWVDYGEYVSSDIALLGALRQLSSHGLVFLRNVPDDETSVVTIAKRIGPLRDSFYGRTWDVRSVPDAKNIAYTHQYLGLHMDLLYMTNPPHLQLLHSLRAQAPGGESLFSDSFYAAETIRREDLTKFFDLVDFPVTYHYKNAAQHYQHTRPTIELELAGIVGGQGGYKSSRKGFFNDVHEHGNARIPHFSSAIQRINWSPPFQGPFQQSLRKLPYYQRAAKRFSDLVNADENTFELRLSEGECVIFDNRRVLHARKAFDISGGERWLKGAYVDDDVYHSRLRVLEEASEAT